jgi:hypothetical protein
MTQKIVGVVLNTAWMGEAGGAEDRCREFCPGNPHEKDTF